MKHTYSIIYDAFTNKIAIRCYIKNKNASIELALPIEKIFCPLCGGEIKIV